MDNKWHRNLDSLSFDEQKALEAICTRVATETEPLLREVKAKTNGNSLAFLHATVELAEKSVAVLLRGKPRIACQRGCAHCCSVRVEALPFELYGIASYLVDVYPLPEVVALYWEIEERAEKGKGLDPDAYILAKIPCAFLTAENECAIYPVRPINCAIFHSLDVAECIAAQEDPRKTLRSYPDVTFGSYAVVVGGLRVLDPAHVEKQLEADQPDHHSALLPILRDKILSRYGRKALL